MKFYGLLLLPVAYFYFLHISPSIAQVNPPEVKSWLDYGLTVAFIGLLIYIFWYLQKSEALKEAKRSERYQSDNKVRDERYGNLIKELSSIIKENHTSIQKIDANYNEAIEKFIVVINKQMDQNNYIVRELTDLKNEIQTNLKLNSRDFKELERAIINKIDSLTLHYEISRKEL
jgi:hypothetical protein